APPSLFLPATASVEGRAEPRTEEVVPPRAPPERPKSSFTRISRDSWFARLPNKWTANGAELDLYLTTIMNTGLQPRFVTTDRESYSAVRANDHARITIGKRRPGFADALAEQFVTAAPSFSSGQFVT